jgi:hypothetical protein
MYHEGVLTRYGYHGSRNLGTIIQFFYHGQSMYLGIQSTQCIFVQYYPVSQSVIRSM